MIDYNVLYYNLLFFRKDIQPIIANHTKIESMDKFLNDCQSMLHDDTTPVKISKENKSTVWVFAMLFKIYKHIKTYSDHKYKQKYIAVLTEILAILGDVILSSQDEEYMFV